MKSLRSWKMVLISTSGETMRCNNIVWRPSVKNITHKSFFYTSVYVLFFQWFERDDAWNPRYVAGSSREERS